VTEERVIVRDEGFAADDMEGARALDLGPGDDVAGLDLDGVVLVRIAFPKFADGRGFTLARRLRAIGYSGRLRASGHVLADQYAMARRSGFDEVEIPAELAARQDESQWRARADWRAGDHRARLGPRAPRVAG
jgi:uncharacterized protein (DUF934 family)